MGVCKMSKNIDERLEMYYKNEFFEKHRGLPEAIIAFEQKINLNMPSEFVVPPFVYYEIGENQVLLGKVHNYYLFGMKKEDKVTYQLFENKSSLKLFFAHINDLEKEDKAFWLSEVESIDFNIKKILNTVKEVSE